MRLSIIFILTIGVTCGSFAQNVSSGGIVFGQSFKPDYTFKGSSVKGMNIVGQANWQAQNGELVGKAKAGSNGGWLLLDKAYQDVGFHAVFKITAGTETGVLFRVEKTAEGMNGILLSLKEEDVGLYQLMIDHEGKEINREKLRTAGGIFYRMAPPVNKNDTTPVRASPPRPVIDVPLPVTRTNTALRTGEWN